MLDKLSKRDILGFTEYHMRWSQEGSFSTQQRTLHYDKEQDNDGSCRAVHDLLHVDAHFVSSCVSDSQY